MSLLGTVSGSDSFADHRNVFTIICVCVCVCMRVHAFILICPMLSLWKSAGNLEESVLSFLSVGSGI